MVVFVWLFVVVVFLKMLTSLWGKCAADLLFRDTTDFQCTLTAVI